MAETGSKMGTYLVRAAGCAGVLLVLAIAVPVATVWAGGWALNAGAVSVPEITAEWTVSFRKGPHGGQAASGEAALALKEAIEGHCRPMRNGLNVAYQHLWYNAITTGYDQQLWIERRSTYDEYALYLSDRTVFLRDEVSDGGYHNRVLVCDLATPAFEQLAIPYLTGDSTW
ncbi:MAG: hypothetical protein JXX28_16900 [Deltaproteobacteria bacterium]|nr:hypothetical protein [Deltaproteobacteria bacterium]